MATDAPRRPPGQNLTAHAAWMVAAVVAFQKGGYPVVRAMKKDPAEAGECKGNYIQPYCITGLEERKEKNE